MGAVGRFSVRVLGKGGHGAIPQQARDPVLAAAHVVTALQQIVARNIDPLEGAVVTVGAIHGGEAFNVIPEEVRLDGTLRCFDEDVWEALPGHVERVATHTAEAFGCRAEVEVERLRRATINDPARAALVREVAEAVVGAENVVELQTLTSEDFSEFLCRVPGCFFFVGSRNAEKGLVHPHHSPRFDVDEDVLPIATELMVGVANRALQLPAS
jgi:amidohydrolase